MEWEMTVKTEIFWENPSFVTLKPQIFNDNDCDGTQAALMRSFALTTWAMAWLHIKKFIFHN
jgi:hypothetical protein